ncbi:MAG: KH domain-containing protein [Clostridiales bacterium]|jgi:spoIIIJ-associated protein|nr:KH domain-containing protein [Clostridiales bacterium]
MKRTVEIVAKKVDDAIQEGLKKLGVTIDDADVTVLESGGFFKKAKVLISVGEDDPVKPSPAPNDAEKPARERSEKREKTEKPERSDKPERSEKVAADKPDNDGGERPEKPGRKFGGDSEKPEKRFGERPERNFGESPEKKPRTDKPPREPKPPRAKPPITDGELALCGDYLSGLLQKMGVEGTVLAERGDDVSVTVDTEDSAVIGYRGEVLDALQYLVSLALNTARGKYAHVSLDALGYRQKRIDTLKRLARKTAEKAVRSGRKVALEPMPSSERRIIHAELADDPGVVTRSEGREPMRRVSVMPKR